MAINLAGLLTGVAGATSVLPIGLTEEDIPVSAVTSDSRAVVPGTLFLALAGEHFDGHDFIEDAVARKCSAVVLADSKCSTEIKEYCMDKGVALVAVADTTKTYALIAANYYGNPAREMILVGVTGTNGKTTVTYLVEDVLRNAGIGVGVIGTVSNRYTPPKGELVVLPSRYTTPEAMSLQALLKKMKDAGVSHVIMEVSSHGLAQSRVGSLVFAAAAFTNFTRDHLDYHGSMEEYFEAKLGLFTSHLGEEGIAVLPLAKDEDPFLKRVHESCRRQGKKILAWGEGQQADISLLGYDQHLEYSELSILSCGRKCRVETPLVGYYNIENILTAFAICQGLSLDHQTICQGLALASGAPGRVERVELDGSWPSGGPTILVDYAHTPDALKKVLEAVKQLPHGELFCVFGCGGDRDKGKRPVMGDIATTYADVAIITDDNPRTEDPDLIVAAIEAGIGPEKTRHPASWLGGRRVKDLGYTVIRDRREAIFAAITKACPGDIVLIAGKGHEPYQLTINGKNYFDDRCQARDALFSWTPTLVAKAVGLGGQAADFGEGFLGEVVTDSRVKSDKGIFVALKGENHDAHDYLEQAAANGCRCLVVERQIPLAQKGVQQLVVPDTTRALGDLAAFRRHRLRAFKGQQVVGITGSCGKTTVKEMVAAIFKRIWPQGADYPSDAVLKTKGNFNNLIGLPLSLLPLGVNQRAAVLEMGMNVGGEIARLAEIADPDISCIVNIHGAHLEGLGSIEGVAAAKEELFAGTREDGILVVNLDDKRVARLAQKYSQKTITFAKTSSGQSGDIVPDVFASGIEADAQGMTTFTLHHDGQKVEVHLFIAGEHNVSNSLCAAAIAFAAGATVEQVVAGLADFRPPEKRMQICRGRQGSTVINDCYNANPASMAAGLTTLKQMSKGRSIAIVGDMLELGKDASDAHYAVGSLIAKLDLSAVAVLGDYRLVTTRGALENGFPKEQIVALQSKQEAVAWYHGLLADNGKECTDTILVKASRGLRFETIVEALLEENNARL